VNSSLACTLRHRNFHRVLTTVGTCKDCWKPLLHNLDDSSATSTQPRTSKNVANVFAEDSNCQCFKPTDTSATLPCCVVGSALELASTHLWQAREYKTVFEATVPLFEDLDGQPDRKRSVKQALDDPLVKILLRESNLTPIQLETFLIDHIVSKNSRNKKEMTVRMALRIDREQITRGSFNRTLLQASRNVIRSIYTIFLLGYLGIFDSPCLEPFISTSNQIRSYMDRLRTQEGKTTQENERIILALAQELRATIENLAGTRLKTL